MSRLTVMGLDLSSTSTGIAIVQETDDPSLFGVDVFSAVLTYKPVKSEMLVNPAGPKRKKESRSLTAKQKIERIMFQRDEIIEYAQSYNVEAVGIEGYAFSRNSSAVTGLAELGGVVRVAILEQLRLVPFTIPVSMARKFVAGKNMKKVDAHKWLSGAFPEGDGVLGEDEKDALFIALATFYAQHPGRRGQLSLEQIYSVDEIVKTMVKQAGPFFDTGIIIKEETTHGKKD